MLSALRWYVSSTKTSMQRKYPVVRSAFAGAMPLQSAISLILVFYYCINLAMLHALVADPNSSCFEYVVGISSFFATVIAFWGLFSERAGKFIPLLIIQICGLFAFCIVWLFYVAEICLVYRGYSARGLALWLARWLFCSSLVIVQFICTYTVHRYVNILYTKKADDSPLQLGKTSRAEGLGNENSNKRDESRYFDVKETPSRKKVSFAV